QTSLTASLRASLNTARRKWVDTVTPQTESTLRAIRSTWYKTTPAHRPWYKRFEQRLNEDNVIWGIIGVNVAVFLMWQYADSVAKTRRGTTEYLRFMYENFTVGWRHVIKEGRPWAALLANFSHKEIWHLALNMIVLYSFGPAVISIVGPRHFIELYLVCGIASSCVSMLRGYLTNSQRPSLGASGCVTGTTIVFAATYPTATVNLFMFLPVPAALAIGGFFLYDVYRSMSGRSGSVDTFGHIG
ncbi:hypothetical protein HK104_004628, partial [Borealophlyctis nickersoniae]